TSIQTPADRPGDEKSSMRWGKPARSRGIREPSPTHMPVAPPPAFYESLSSISTNLCASNKFRRFFQTFCPFLISFADKTFGSRLASLPKKIRVQTIACPPCNAEGEAKP